MTTTITGLDRRTGTASVAAGLLLFSGVAGELAVSGQADDGTLTRPWLASAYTATWVVGSAALVLALRGLRRLSPPDPSRRRRSGRTGYRLSLAGAGLLVAFGVVHLVTGAVTGAPAEASFLLFALGLVLSVVGQVLTGLHLRRTCRVGGWWVALPVAASGLLAGVLVPADPWHDLGLFAFDAPGSPSARICWPSVLAVTTPRPTGWSPRVPEPMSTPALARPHGTPPGGWPSE